jgi:hypothetical protein
MELRGFRNVGKPQSDAGEIPKRIHTRFKTRRTFEIKKSFSESLHLLRGKVPLSSFWQRSGCGQGKALQDKEGKVMGNGILGIRACVRAPEKEVNI